MHDHGGCGPSGGRPPSAYLSLEDLFRLCADLGDLKVRDIGLLDSAAHRPGSAFGGQEAYPTLASTAAALLQSVVMNHALVDGNKRLVIDAITAGMDVAAIAERLRVREVGSTAK